MNQKKTILVLEDEKSLLSAIKALLELQKFNVVTAKAVDQALDYLKQGVKIDVIWLDHYLFGKQNGLDFVTKLKGHKTWKNLPVFVVSNTVTPDKIQTYRSLGVQKCYTKVDYRLGQIVADIEKYLKDNKP